MNKRHIQYKKDAKRPFKQFEVDNRFTSILEDLNSFILLGIKLPRYKSIKAKISSRQYAKIKRAAINNEYAI